MLHHFMIRKILLVLLLITSTLASAARIKDITSVAGVRENQLIGYGLVVGLNGTGDRTAQTPFTTQSFRSMLTQLGVRVPSGTSFQLKNVAAVAISATLPAFANNGQKIDITVSSVGNSKSLRGGTLLMAPLRGLDNKVYAMAQGNVIVSGLGAQGADGSKITVNIPSTGRIPNGALIERTIKSPFLKKGIMQFQLHRADFTTVKRVADAINKAMRHQMAKALNASTVSVNLVKVLTKYGKDVDNATMIALISKLENLTVESAEGPAKIVINARTGTVVISQHVTVSPAAVSHGSLSVIITEDPIISQPGPLSNGETAEATDSQISVDQEKSRAFLFAPGSSLNDIVKAVNKVGAAPGDLVAILESLKTAGALHAELVVI
jgi:flagellar P-ring protein precursor FlgI